MGGSEKDYWVVIACTVRAVCFDRHTAQHSIVRANYFPTLLLLFRSCFYFVLAFGRVFDYLSWMSRSTPSPSLILSWHVTIPLPVVYCVHTATTTTTTTTAAGAGAGRATCCARKRTCLLPSVVPANDQQRAKHFTWCHDVVAGGQKQKKKMSAMTI